MRRGRNKIVVTAEADEAADHESAAEAASTRARMGTATDQALATVATTVLPALVEARERLVPVAEQAAARGRTRARQAAARGRTRGRRAGEQSSTRGRRAAAQSLEKGRKAAMRLGVLDAPKKQTHWLRNLLIMLGLGAAGATAFRMLSGRDADPAWTAGRDAAAPSAPVAVAEPGDPGDDSVPWGDTAPDQMAGMDASAVDPEAAESTGDTAPVVAEPAGSDPVEGDSADAAAGSDTAPTAPFASEETAESTVPTDPDEPLEKHDVS
jgi:hypothetical protein